MFRVSVVSENIDCALLSSFVRFPLDNCNFLVATESVPAGSRSDMRREQFLTPVMALAADASVFAQGGEFLLVTARRHTFSCWNA